MPNKTVFRVKCEKGKETVAGYLTLMAEGKRWVGSGCLERVSG